MRVKLWLWMLLLLVMFLGSQRLDESLWVDEVWSVYYAGGAQYGPLTLSETVNRVVDNYHHERNPPGYYILLNLWGGAVGWSETATRILSLLAGLLAVAWMYRLASEIFSSTAGLGAAFTLGLSAFYISYLHEMRVYTIYVLLVIVVLWAYWRIIRSHNPGVGIQLTYMLGIVAMFYTYFFGLLLLAGVGLAHLLFVRKNRMWWQVGVLTAAAILTFVPWLGLLLQATSQSITVIPAGALETGELVNQIILYFSNYSVALLGFVLIGAINLREWKARFIWLIAIVVFGLVVLISARFQVFLHTRYVLVLWPLLALVCGLGIERLAQRGVPPAWILGVWTLAGVWGVLFGYAPKMPYIDLITYLETHGLTGDQLAFHAPDWDWLTEIELDHYMYDVPMDYTLLERLPGLRANLEYGRNALAWMGDAPRIWLAVDRRLEPNFRLHEFELALTRDYVGCGTEYAHPLLDLSLYARKVTQPHVKWENDIGLSVIAPVEVDAARQLKAMLGWQTSFTAETSFYSMGLHVLDGAGQLVAQQDTGLPGMEYVCERHVIDLQQVPAGDYSLAVVVYDWRSGERVAGVAGGEDGDYFTLAAFTLN